MKRSSLMCSALLLLIASPAYAENVAAKESSVTGGTLMLVSYIALWLLIFGYLALLSRRLTKSEEDFSSLRKELDDRLQLTDD